MAKCLTCGKIFPDTSLTKPRSYCSDDCRDYVKYKNALERILIRLDPDYASFKLIKGDMFRLANVLSIGTKLPLSTNEVSDEI